MELANLVIEVVGISASGVLAPGPLFFANLFYGARQGPRAGLKMAYGHSVVELPLVTLMAAGIFSSSALLKSSIDIVGILGGLAILGFATIQILTVTKVKRIQMPGVIDRRGPFVAGIALSVLNPFFIVWWLTVGLKIVADSVSFGIVAGAVLVFASHVWMDYAWLVTTAYLSSRGRLRLNSKYYSVLMLGLTGILLYFGMSFLLSSLASITN